MIDRRPDWQKSKPVAYACTFGFMALVGLMGWATGGSAGLVFLQVASVPVIFMACHGVEQAFLTDEAYRRWTPQFFERVFATEAVVAIGIMFLMARDGTSIGGHLINFTIMFVVLSALELLGPLGPVRFEPGKPNGKASA